MFLWGLGESMFFIFQPLYLQEWKASPILIGTLLSVNGLVVAITMILSGFFTDRFGSRPVLWASWLIGTFASIVMALANSLPFFIVGMIAYAFSSFAMPPMSRYVVMNKGNFSVERVLSLMVVFFNSGAVIGVLIGGKLASSFGIRANYIAAAFIFVLSTLAIFSISRDQPPIHTTLEGKQNKAPIFSIRFVGFIAISMLTMLALTMPQPLSSNFLQNQRLLSFTQIGQLGSIGNLGNVLLVLLLGSLPAFWGVIASLILVGGFSFLMLEGSSFFWLGLGYFLYAGARLGRSMLNAMVPKMFSGSNIGSAYGIVESSNGMALILSPFLAGILYDFEPTSIFTVSLASIAVIVLLDLIFLRKILQDSEKANAKVMEDS